ncbi:MAG TPA: SAVED domain-containing protein, partial [Armatimonadetes bacterium]|nr:SAVED domain-containing protein [Armatimonadota bacterium]
MRRSAHFFLISIIWDGICMYRKWRHKHVPIVIAVGRSDDEVKAMVHDALQTMRGYYFDEDAFRREFDVERDDWLIKRESALGDNATEWENVVKNVLRAVNRILARLPGGKTFHIFINAPACLAMGIGAALGTRYELVLHHYQPGTQQLYHPVIDFHARRSFTPEGVHVLMTRVCGELKFVEICRE